jgi:hypothetical protein
MKEFMIVHVGFKMPTEEQMGLWNAWFASVAEHKVDGAGMRGGSSFDGNKVTDLAFDETATTGYTIIKAEDMEAAMVIAKQCPVVTATEVHELMRF